MQDAELITVEVDFGNVSGYFVRLDVEIPSGALQNGTSEDGGPRGWLALAPDEADRLADRLRDCAERVRGLLTRPDSGRDAQDDAGVKARVRALELYRHGRWRYSVLEEPMAKVCGPLPGLSADAGFEAAVAALLDLLQARYRVRYEPRWQQTGPEWWVADLEEP